MSAPQPSERLVLAGLVAEAARGVSGVADLDAGPAGLFATVGGTTRVAGVTCTSAPEGGFDVSLRLVCELTDFTQLADAVRSAVQSAGREAGIAVASATVEIADVVDPGAEAEGAS